MPDKLRMVVPGQYGGAAPDAVGDTHLRSSRRAELQSHHVEDDMSASTGVVALDAQLLRRADLSPHPVEAPDLTPQPSP